MVKALLQNERLATREKVQVMSRFLQRFRVSLEMAFEGFCDAYLARYFHANGHHLRASALERLERVHMVWMKAIAIIIFASLGTISFFTKDM